MTTGGGGLLFWEGLVALLRLLRGAGGADEHIVDAGLSGELDHGGLRLR